MKNRVRFAVIGAGSIGQQHMEALRQCSRAELVAVAESNPQRLREATERFGLIAGHTDYREVLARPDVNAVSIALPNFLHAPAALAALRAGKHVHLEKPMALNAREAARVIAVAKRKQRVLMVGQNMRFTRDAQMLKLQIEQGALGDVYHARAWWIRRQGIPRLGSWFTQKRFAGGGALLDIGVHMLDLALYLMDNFQPQSVAGITHARFGPRGLGGGGWGSSEIDKKAVFDVDDYAVALIRLKGGKSVILEAAWAAHLPEPSHGVQLYGTDGGAAIFPARVYRRSARPPAYEIITPESMPLPFPEERLHHFVDCILDRKKPLVAPRKSLAVQRILDAVYESAHTGREVRL